MPEESQNNSFDITELAVDTFKDYETVFTSKETVRKVCVLLFSTEPDDISSKDLGQIISGDKPIVRQKYSLPDESIWINQPEEYYRLVSSIASKEGVQITNIEDVGGFFESRLGSGVYLHKRDTIAMDLLQDNDKKNTVAQKAATLEHELIHALQYRRYPQMSLLRKEYEAYVAHGNEYVLKNIPWLFLERIVMSLTIDQLEQQWQDYQQKSQLGVGLGANNP